MDKRHTRYYIVFACLALFACAIVVRYAALAFSGPGAPGPAAPAEITRGSLFDRNGRLLATQTELYDVSLWRPSMDGDAWRKASGDIASILGLDAAAMRTRVSDSPADFLYIAKRVSGDVATALRERAAAGSVTGMRVDRVPGRVYPERRLAAQLIGFVGHSNEGLAGSEAAFEDYLSGPGEAVKGTAVYGRDVYLTIDADIQYRLEELSRAVMEETKAESLVLVAMDAKNGEILSYISLPDFDPNEFLSSDASAWTDRAAVWAYEPGSVFKVFSMASVMDLGGIDGRSGFVCDGAFRKTLPSGETITIKCEGRHGTVHLQEILEYSCNAGAGYAAETIAPLDFYAKLREFGFGDRTGTSISGESPGVFRHPDTWSARSRPTIAMGQEILVTAVQVAEAATAIANGGLLLRPQTLARVVAHDGRLLREGGAEPVRRVIEPDTARAILSAMEAASGEAGSGRRAKLADVRMSVKTGTSQIIDPATRKYSATDFISSMLAIFPTDDPEIILYAAIFKPRGDFNSGSRIAAPLIRDAADVILDLKGLARGAAATVDHSGRVSLPRSDPVSIGETMPDLSGVPKRLLVPLLERRDISVRIEGEGWVYAQEPAPGSPVPSGTTVTLRLK